MYLVSWTSDYHHWHKFFRISAVWLVFIWYISFFVLVPKNH